MHAITSRVSAMIAFGALIIGPAAWADTWAPPETKEYLSADGKARLTVIPRDWDSRLAYFGDKVDQAPADTSGILEIKTSNGQWVSSWETQLLNEVAPVSALVADGGSYVITFDNWGSMGFGDNVVVIYGTEGQPIRSLRLSDFLTKNEIDDLPHSVSSINWGRDHRISDDGKTLLLQVIAPDQDIYADKAVFDQLSIELTNGKVAGWDRRGLQARQYGLAAILILLACAFFIWRTFRGSRRMDHPSTKH